MLVVVLAVLMVAGCSTGERPAAGPPPAPAPAPPAVKDERPLIVAFGDSLTEGYGVEAGSKYPDLLQQALDERGYRWRVVNAGVSGDTTANALERLAGVLAAKPRIVILEIGGNDGLRGLPIETTQRNLEEIIAALQGAGVRVLLWGMTLPANYGSAYVRDFERMYAGVAARYRVRLIPLRAEAARLADDSRLMQRDGIHPTGEGYRALVPVILRYLEPELKR